MQTHENVLVLKSTRKETRNNYIISIYSIPRRISTTNYYQFQPSFNNFLFTMSQILDKEKRLHDFIDISFTNFCICDPGNIHNYQ